MFESKTDRRYLTWIVVALLTLGFLAVMTQLTQSEAAEEINQDAIQDTIPSALIAGDYAIFAQARDGAAREISDDESNDSQVSVSGSDNHLFGRIPSGSQIITLAPYIVLTGLTSDIFRKRDVYAGIFNLLLDESVQCSNPRLTDGI